MGSLRCRWRKALGDRMDASDSPSRHGRHTEHVIPPVVDTHEQSHAGGTWNAPIRLSLRSSTPTCCCSRPPRLRHINGAGVARGRDRISRNAGVQSARRQESPKFFQPKRGTSQPASEAETSDLTQAASAAHRALPASLAIDLIHTSASTPIDSLPQSYYFYLPPYKPQPHPVPTTTL